MSMNFLWGVFMSLTMSVLSQTVIQGGNFHFEPKQRKLFSLWEEDKEILVAAEMLIGEYPEQTLMSKIINSEKEIDLSIPENLITYEHNLTKKADLKTILNNYYDNDDKEFAQKVYHNIQHSQDWILKHIKDIEFRTKAVFGDLIRIKCKQIETNQKAIAISWNTLCKQYGKRYFFVAPKEENGLFSILSEAYPYWDPKRIQMSEDKIKGMTKISLVPTSSNQAQPEASKIDVYLKIKKFDDMEEGSLKKDVQEVLSKLKVLYIENNKDGLLELCFPKRRKNVKSSLLDITEVYEQSKAYFQKCDGVISDCYIGTPNACFVFGRKVVDGKAEDSIKIFKFIRENGTLYLSDSMEPLYLEEKEELYMTEKVIEHPQMRKFYNKILREN